MSYLNTDVFVLCIDYAHKDSLENAERWVEDLKATKAPIIVCLTKCDQGRALSKEEIQKFSLKHGISGVFECSAYDRTSLKNIFEAIIRIYTDWEPSNTGYYYQHGFC